MKERNLVAVGIRSHVVGLDSRTGSERWRTKLKGGQFVITCVRGEHVYAGVTGEIFCLRRSTGAVLWHNRLPRLGFGLVSFAGDPARQPRDLVVGIKGHVVAVEASTGREIWRAKLSSSVGSQAVTLALLDDQTILAGTSGELFAVHRSLGKVLWNAKLKGLGVGLVSLGSNEIAIATAIAQARAAAAASG